MENKQLKQNDIAVTYSTSHEKRPQANNAYDKAPILKSRVSSHYRVNNEREADDRGTKHNRDRM